MAGKRIHIIASDLKLTDDDVLELCEVLGIEADAPSTFLDDKDVRKIKHHITRAKIEKVEEAERLEQEKKARKKAEAEAKKREAADKKRRETDAKKEVARKEKEAVARKKAEAERKKREKEDKKRAEEERLKREEEERLKAEELKKREEARRQAAEEIRKREVELQGKRETELKRQQAEKRKKELAKRKAAEKAKLERIRKIKEKLHVIELKKLMSIKSIAPKFGFKPKAMTEKLNELGLQVPQTTHLDKDTLTIFAGEIGYEIIFLGDLATPEDFEKAKAVEVKVKEALREEDEKAREAATAEKEKPKKKKEKPAPSAEEIAPAEGEEKPELVEVEIDLEEDEEPDDPKDLVARPPIVTVMGHVDHGKTSILDYIRKTKVADGEKGGITQHIGAYKIKHQGREIVFIDTPGHEAFTEMRARGTKVTDIVVVVIAADDGVMPQTLEAINHAQSAGVPIIVAINKIDKPNAMPDQAKQQLMQYNLLPEDWGGETIVCDVSALNGTGIDHLLEMINLQAEIMELKANPKRKMRGVVIESQVCKGRGAVASVIINRGVLKVGDVVVCGSCFGKVKALSDENGNRLKSAGPATPVEIMGLSDPSPVGAVIRQVDSERDAREIVEARIDREKLVALQGTVAAEFSLDDFLKGPEEEAKELRIVLKGDAQGTIEALAASLEKIGTEKAKVNILHSAVGTVGESDVMLACASTAVIIAFNTRADPNAVTLAEKEGVLIHYFDIIYRAIEEIQAVLEGLLEPVFNEVVVGEIEIRQLFSSSSLGTIAGCIVRNGTVSRNLRARINRNDQVIWQGEISSLRHFKEEVREVKTGMECGIRLKNFYDFEIGDLIEVVKLERVAQTL